MIEDRASERARRAFDLSDQPRKGVPQSSPFEGWEFALRTGLNSWFGWHATMSVMISNVITPSLAKNARLGHPMFYYRKDKQVNVWATRPISLST